ncbi:MAG: glycosyltransferase family 9 protein [Alphaproteobacteria bacterium]|nr:glycosyltransferase family 9 protein [Alphaproteobacteria bacterium]
MTSAQDKILVIKLGALGDFIQALGPMAAIRKHHPNAHITILTTKPFENFAKDCGYFNEIWLDDRPRITNVISWIALRTKLNSAKFNRVYDLQNNDRTGFYYKLFSPKPEWSGIAKGASHRNANPDRSVGHAFDGHAETLAIAGIKEIKPDPLLWMVEDTSHFALNQPYILLVPGCAPERPEKRWPSDKYGRLANMLVKRGFQPVLIGTKAEADATQIIVHACPEALDLTGQTSLKHIVTLARHSAGAIGNDTGPMHLIGATGTPCLVLFSGHSNPVKHAPKGGRVSVLQEDDLKDLKSEDVLNAFEPCVEPTKGNENLH